jgi:hypothetical protein
MKSAERFTSFPALVLARLFLAACASIPPSLVVHVSPDGQSARVLLTGWVVSGLILLIKGSTRIDGIFPAGDIVHMRARINPDGSFSAAGVGPAGSTATVMGHLEFSGLLPSNSSRTSSFRGSGARNSMGITD